MTNNFDFYVLLVMNKCILTLGRSNTVPNHSFDVAKIYKKECCVGIQRRLRKREDSIDWRKVRYRAKQNLSR